MQAVSACTSAGSVAGNIATRSWLRPSLRYGSTSTIPFARSVAASAAASTCIVEVDRADDQRALGGIADERRRVRVRARPSRRGALEEAVRARDHRLEAALREHPLELVGEQEQRRDRRRVVGLVLDGVLERRRQRQELGDPAAAPTSAGRVELRDPLRARRGSAARATARRRTRSPSAARSSRRRPGRRRPAGRRRRGRVDQHQRVVVRAVGTHDRDHHAGRGLVVRPGDHVARAGSNAGSGASPAGASITIGSSRNGAPRVQAANFEENSP